jgi:hypothetical protein
MHGNILPAPAGQVGTSLGDLAKAIREAHASVVNALNGAVEHAIRCGNIIADAKQQAGHGRWGEFLRACEINERTARRYVQLADLAQNGRATTDLTGLTIEGAIKKLSPPRPPRSAVTAKQLTGPKPKPSNGSPRKRTIHVDIIETWLAASPNDRTKAIEGISLNAYLAAMPGSWLPLIEKRLAERNTAPAPAAVDPAHLIPADLSIPEFMRRI